MANIIVPPNHRSVAKAARHTSIHADVIDLPLLHDHRPADVLEDPRPDVQFFHSLLIFLLPLLERVNHKFITQIRMSGH